MDNINIRKQMKMKTVFWIYFVLILVVVGGLWYMDRTLNEMIAANKSVDYTASLQDTYRANPVYLAASTKTLNTEPLNASAYQPQQFDNYNSATDRTQTAAGTNVYHAAVTAPVVEATPPVTLDQQVAQYRQMHTVYSVVDVPVESSN